MTSGDYPICTCGRTTSGGTSGCPLHDTLRRVPLGDANGTRQLYVPPNNMVDARYHNPIANKPGDEAEQNPIPEDLCPVCGKGNSELFMAGHEDDGTEVWGSRGISHIDCAWQLHAEMYRPQPYYYDQWKTEKQRADEAEAALAKMTARHNGEQRAKAKAERSSLRWMKAATLAEAKQHDAEAKLAAAEAERDKALRELNSLLDILEDYDPVAYSLITRKLDEQDDDMG